MIFNSFPSPSRNTVLPQNYKRGKVVKEYVEYYADSQKIRQDEALQVQGSDIVIWNRAFSKRYCTCQGLVSSIHNNPAVIKDLNPEVIAEDRQYEIEAAKQNSVFTHSKNKSLSNTLHSAGLDDLSSLVDSLYDEEVVEPIPAATINIPQTKKQNSILEEAFIVQKKNLGVELSDYVNCPICFGTRHTDSYQPHRGVRIILDGSDYYPFTLTGVQLNKDAAPYLFTFADITGGSVIWNVTLPKYFKVVSLKAYNLEHVSTSVKLSYAQSDSNSFSPLSSTSLQSRSGQSNKLKIKCEVNPSNITDNLANVDINISHIEVVLLYCNDYDKAELPMLTIPEQIDYQELYLRSRFVLSPRIATLGRNDLISENKYGLLWQVVDLEKTYTNAGSLLSLKADVRLVQNSEKLYNLSTFARKMNTWQTSL